MSPIDAPPVASTGDPTKPADAGVSEENDQDEILFWDDLPVRKRKQSNIAKLVASATGS